MITHLSQRTFWKKFFNYFLVVVGIISGFVQIVSVSYTKLPAYGWKVSFWLFGVSLLIALFTAWPRKSFSESFSNPDVKIGVKIGNIFDQEGHLVIGFSDTFDTEIGDVISATSMQGQFLVSVYNNNRSKLDSELDALLQNEPCEEDATKILGKNKRYEIGTVVTLTDLKRKFFCCAYSRMGADLKATSDVNHLWKSLQTLWTKIRKEGEQKTVFIPVIGTNLSRVPGISHKMPINLILLSFIINSRIEPISKELVLMISEADREKVDMIELEDFVKSLHN